MFQPSEGSEQVQLLEAHDASSMSFKSGNAFLNEMDQIEEENRKEFACNNLTVLSNGNNTSTDNPNASKWWNQSIAQTSKLELSRLSNSFDKRVYAVDDYFTQKSEMPQYLARMEHGVNIMVTPTATSHHGEALEESGSADFTLSSSSTRLSSMGTNFSFTFNASEHGDFIRPKTTATMAADASGKLVATPQTPFQITRMLNRKVEAEAIAKATAAKASAALASDRDG